MNDNEEQELWKLMLKTMKLVIEIATEAMRYANDEDGLGRYANDEDGLGSVIAEIIELLLLRIFYQNMASGLRSEQKCLCPQASCAAERRRSAAAVSIVSSST